MPQAKKHTAEEIISKLRTAELEIAKGRPTAEAPKSTLSGLAPAVGTQKPEPWAKKWRKIHWARKAGGALLQSWLLRVWIGSRFSPSGKCRFVGLGGKDENPAVARAARASDFGDLASDVLARNPHTRPEIFTW